MTMDSMPVDETGRNESPFCIDLSLALRLQAEAHLDDASLANPKVRSSWRRASPVDDFATAQQ